jgi:hypothetical protein
MGLLEMLIKLADLAVSLRTTLDVAHPDLLSSLALVLLPLSSRWSYPLVFFLRLRLLLLDWTVDRA